MQDRPERATIPLGAGLGNHGHVAAKPRDLEERLAK